MPLTEQQQAAMLRREMDKQRVVDPRIRAGIAAIAMGESGFQMKPEVGYAHTSNLRIRSIFGARVSGMTDQQLDALKVDDRAFFNRVYGGTWGLSHLGNTQPDDGYTFRGRGMFDITGRANYKRYGDKIGVNLIGNPELADDPHIACALCVIYIRDRYKGGGWAEMKRVVGFNIPDIERTKDRLYAQYVASGEFGPMPDAGEGGDTGEV